MNESGVIQLELLLFIFDKLCFLFLLLISEILTDKDGINVLFVFILDLYELLLVLLFFEDIFPQEEYLFNRPFIGGLFFKYEWAFLNLSPIPKVLL